MRGSATKDFLSTEQQYIEAGEESLLRMKRESAVTLFDAIEKGDVSALIGGKQGHLYFTLAHTNVQLQVTASNNSSDHNNELVKIVRDSRMYGKWKIINKDVHEPLTLEEDQKSTPPISPPSSSDLFLIPDYVKQAIHRQFLVSSAIRQLTESGRSSADHQLPDGDVPDDQRYLLEEDEQKAEALSRVSAADVQRVSHESTLRMYVCRLLVWDVVRRKGHKPDPEFLKHLHSLGILFKTSGHVLTEGALKPLGFLLLIIYGTQFISGALTPENLDKPVAYPNLLWLGLIPWALTVIPNMQIQYRYARITLSDLKPAEMDRAYWDSQAINEELGKLGLFTVDFRNLKNLLNPGVDKDNVLKTYNNIGGQPHIVPVAYRQADNDLAKKTQLELGALTFVESTDAACAATIFGLNLLLPHLASSETGWKVTAVLASSIIGAFLGYFFKVTPAVGSTALLGYNFEDALRFYRQGIINQTPLERSPLMKASLSYFPALTIGEPLLFAGLHVAAIANTTMSKWVKGILAFFALLGPLKKTKLFDVVKAGENGLGLTRKEIFENPFAAVRSDFWRTWLNKTAAIVGLDRLKLDKPWKQHFFALVSYAPGLFFLATEALKNVYVHMILPLISDSDESLAPLTTLLGDVSSYAGFVFMVLAAIVTIPQTSQFYNSMKQEQMTSGDEEVEVSDPLIERGTFNDVQLERGSRSMGLEP